MSGPERVSAAVVALLMAVLLSKWQDLVEASPPTCKTCPHERNVIKAKCMPVLP